METVMTVTSVVYFAIAAGTWPAFTRYRYRQRRSRHPQTHERDVYADVLHALAEGALCAVLWLPVIVARYTLQGGWWLARIVLGKSFRADLSAARTARFEAELAAMDAPEAHNVVRLRTAELRDQVRSMRALIAEAEQLKRQIDLLAEHGRDKGVEADAYRRRLIVIKEELALRALDYERDAGLARVVR